MTGNKNLQIILNLLRSYIDDTPLKKTILITDDVCEFIHGLDLSPIAMLFEASTDFSKSCREILHSANVANKFWRSIQDDSAKELIKKLAKKNITPVLLKGISVSSQVYPHSYIRRMSDIDLLVDENDISETEKKLEELGYIQHSIYDKEFYETLHHTMPWQHSERDIWFEIHKQLFPESSTCSKAKVFNLSTIKKETVDGEFSGVAVKLLSPEMQLIYIAAHWAEQFKVDGAIFAFVDVALIINQNKNIDWSKIIEWSNSKYIANYVVLFYSCLIEIELLSNDNADKVNLLLKKTSSNLSSVDLAILKNIVKKYMFLNNGFGRILTENNIAIIWDHLLVSRNYLNKLITLPWYVLFPKSSNERFKLAFQWARLQRMLKLK